MARNENYQVLIQKLDSFIRKFYVNQLIRGSLYTVALVLILFLGMNFLEHYFFFSSGVRKVLFYSFIGLSGLALFVWVLNPVLHYFRLGKIISREKAAEIIGEHFGDVKDKLLNILQLKQQADSAPNQNLILAGIDQKSEEIKLVPFRSAINLGQNRKYLRYALPPLLLLLIVLFTAPSIIRESTNRLINNDTEFAKPAPFFFEVEKEELQVVQFNDFPLTVKVDGEVLPDQVFINIDDYQYRLNKVDANTFTYRFNNVQKAIDFNVFSGGVSSEGFTLDVVKKPNIVGFDVKLDYPNYIGRKDETLTNIGDLVLPVGTKVDWIFNAENTDEIQLQFSNEDPIDTKRFSDDLFTYSKKALKDVRYKLFVSNKALPNADSISYSLTVVPDLYPNIEVEKFQDSLDSKLTFFAGDASDDYGLLNLSFNYRIQNEKGEEGELNSIKIEKAAGKQIQYDYTFDMNELILPPGSRVTYYFEVFDNDAVNGSKSARTQLMVYKVPTVDEYEQKEEENEESIKNDLSKALQESREVQDKMKELREKLLQEKDLDWQSRKELEKLLEEQKKLQKQIQDAKNAFEENLKNQMEFKESDENIMQKQEQLQKLFDEVMSEEMQELMRQIEELMQELEKEDALEMMEDFEFNDEELEKELDRMLELFKQLELEQEMQEAVDKLEELAEKQEELSEKTKDQTAEENAEEKEGEQNESKEGEQNDGDENKQDGEQNEDKEGEQNQDQKGDQNQDQQGEQNQDQQRNQDEKTDQEQLEKEQEEINKEFEEVKEKMESIEEKNKELENPKDVGNKEEEMEDIQQDLDNSQQQLQQQQNQKASESQKKAAQKMRQMAQNMQMQMQSGQMQQMQEDMQALRQLLENLVGLSFDQEDLIDLFKDTDVSTPKYVDLVQDQFKLQDDFRLIEDSLQALSKRVFQIESFVTEKVATIKQNMKQGLEELEERRKPQASVYQQQTMKNVNDLALMLSEVMNQMQQQMSGMMAGSQMCTNPGGQGKSGNVPQDKISQGQQQLNDQMRQMKDGLEKGEGGSSKEFAKMAARQAALRKALREKQKQLQQQGQGDQALQKMIEEMDKVETDLVNKKLTNELLKRQEEILTRLLEHEKAERQREMDQKREARTAEQQKREFPPALEEYLKKREAEIDLYKTVSPNLKPYYKYLVEEYFKSLKSETPSGE